MSATAEAAYEAQLTAALPELEPRKHTYEFVTHPETRRAVFNELRAWRGIKPEWRDASRLDSYRNALADLGMVMSIKLEYRDAWLATAMQLNADLLQQHDADRAAIASLNAALNLKVEALKAARLALTDVQEHNDVLQDMLDTLEAHLD